ncbi:MAG: hypothetical protein MO853_08725 [Candidatus Protistobacter heckmanni]|nr:hypothetical protein [Candidatus Protistobacter heckmanni]
MASAVWIAIALAGLALTTTRTSAVLSAGLLGFAIGRGFILALTLSVICGAAWDWVGKPSMAFAPLTIFPFLLAGFALSLHLGRKA